jgi:hypothetical protein
VLDDPTPGRGRRPGQGILLAWLIFAGLVLLAGGGLGLAVFVNNKPQPRPMAADDVPSEATLAVLPRRQEIDPSPAAAPAPGVRRTEPSVDPAPAPPPAPATDPVVQPPRRTQPPPLPTPPPEPAPPAPPKEAPPSAEKTPTPQPEKLHPPQPEKLAATRAARESAPQVHWLPPDVQRRVDGTIDRGVEFLRRQQHFDGSWGHLSGRVSERFTPGVSALAALTLLECGVPASDPQVQLAARYLRQHMPDITTTYSISTTILFLDRLGESRDVSRLRSLALRLIAGQKPSGGWDYYCPILGEDEELGLLALLYKDRPTSPRDLFGTERIDLPALDLEAMHDPPRLDGELYRPRPSPVPPLDLFIAQAPASRTEPEKPVPPAKPAEQAPEIEDRSPPPPEKPKPEDPGPGLPGDPRRLSDKARTAAANLPESLRKTPALNAGQLLREYPDFFEPRTDNSNTQLAILGLLTVEKHDIPIERTMALIDWRFRNSLTEKLGWNYRPNWPTTPAMTASALTGLALKHGLLLPNLRDRGRHVTVRDPLVQRGFLTLDHLLDRYIDGFYTRRTKLEKLDLYCLWTVERVAVLYNLRRIGVIEWYPEGVKLLLAAQQEDGSWGPGGTTCLEQPSVSTSFALLFLKRSNPARELTERLQAPVAERDAPPAEVMPRFRPYGRGE